MLWKNIGKTSTNMQKRMQNLHIYLSWEMHLFHHTYICMCMNIEPMVIRSSNWTHSKWWVKKIEMWYHFILCLQSHSVLFQQFNQQTFLFVIISTFTHKDFSSEIKMNYSLLISKGKRICARFGKENKVKFMVHMMLPEKRNRDTDDTSEQTSCKETVDKRWMRFYVI